MRATSSHAEVVAALAEDPLRHVVLLKQAMAYPDHVRMHRVSDGTASATLVLLDIAASAYDRAAYPTSTAAAFLSGDRPDLTEALLAHVPGDTGVVFKLSSEADVPVVAARFPLTRRTSFISFTASGGSTPAEGVRITTRPGDAAFRLFGSQGHDEAWLAPLLGDGRAFAAVLEHDGAPLSACFAFMNYGRVWEIGGVVTAAAHRRKGLGTRVVQAALAELGARGLMPRYQVEEGNAASIGLARSVGLAPFLTVTHYVHDA